MENASRALLIAASVLIGVMIISLGVYLFSVFGGTSAKINRDLQMQAIAKFNVQFTKYDGAKDVRAQDILSICKLAEEAKKAYGYNITVKVKNVASKYSNVNGVLNNYDEFLNTYSLTSEKVPQYFTCNSVKEGSNQIVEEIVFTRQ